MAVGVHPDFFPVATGALYPMAERPRDETDHPVPSRVQDKNEWRYNSTSPYALVAYVDSLPFPFTYT